MRRASSTAPRRASVTAGAIVALLFTAVALPAHAEDTAPATQRYILSAGSVATLNSALKSTPADEKDILPELKSAIADLTKAEAAKLDAIPGVSVSPDAPVHLADIQNDAPANLGRLIEPAAAATSSAVGNAQYWYPKSAGKGVNIYVIDTGVQRDEAEFGDRLLPGYDATTDLVGADTDCNSHGTSVASVAAGTTYGVAKLATIIPIRGMNCNGGGNSADIVRGIDWVIANNPAGVPAVINLSIAGVNYPNFSATYQAMDDAASAAVAAGIFVVAAAGNNSNSSDVMSACQVSPARAPTVFTVGSFDGTGQTGLEGRSNFSNAGPCLDAWAPGFSISTLGLGSGLFTRSGTSFAAPAAAGLGALFLADSPASTPADTTTALLNASQPNALENWALRPLDATKLFRDGSTSEPLELPQPSPNLVLQTPAAVPGAGSTVDGLTVSATTTTVTARWSTPASAPIRLRGVNRQGAVTAVTTVAGATSYTFGGLAAGDVYRVTAATITDGLYGVARVIDTATHEAPRAPSTPTGLTVTAGGLASWESAAPNGSEVTGYNVQTSTDKVAWSASTSTSTSTSPIDAGALTGSYQIPGLSTGKTYFARVNAVNAVGTSSWSGAVSFVTPVPALTTTTPTISGTAKVGLTLTANAGAWGPSGVTLTRQWFRSGSAISGATANTYKLAAADRGKVMTVRVLGVKAGYVSASKTSKASAAVAAGTLVAPTPTISGTKRSGYTLTANPGTWGPSPVALTYRWYRSGVAIAGATAKTYRLASADRYDTIKVRVTGVKTGYTAIGKYSASTVKIP